MDTNGIITALTSLITAVGTGLITWIVTWLRKLKKTDNLEIERIQNGRVLKHMENANSLFVEGHQKKDYVLRKVANDCIAKGQNFDYLFWTDKIDDLAKIAKGV